MTRRHPTIIANLTAIGIPGYYDLPNQPHGCVRTEHEELLPVSDALIPTPIARPMSPTPSSG